MGKCQWCGEEKKYMATDCLCMQCAVDYGI